MGLIGGIVGAAVGMGAAGPVGAVVGAVVGSKAGDALGGGGSSTVTYGENPDYSEAMLLASENSKDTAIAAIRAQRFQLGQLAMDSELQKAANLALSIEKLDTNLQTSLLEYRKSMTAEENRHVEKVAADATHYRSMTAGSEAPDLPAPTSEEERG